MTNETHRAYLEDVEDIVDKTSIRYVIDLLAEIAFAKADHVETNWQDRELSNLWRRIGRQLQTQASNPTYNELP